MQEHAPLSTPVSYLLHASCTALASPCAAVVALAWTAFALEVLHCVVAIAVVSSGCCGRRRNNAAYPATKVNTQPPVVSACLSLNCSMYALFGCSACRAAHACAHDACACGVNYSS